MNGRQNQPGPERPELTVMANSEQYRAYQFASFTLDLARGALLTADGTEKPLRPKSFDLLRLLAENAGRLLSREAIMQALWPNVYVTDDNLTQCIHEIRTALGAASGQLLRTLPRRGYLFAPDVIALPEAEPQHPANGAEPTQRAEHRETEPASGDNGPMEPPSSPNPGTADRRPPPRFALMVAPLRNLGVPKEYEYLAAAIPEDIGSELSNAGMVVDEAGMLIAGHGRVLAARKLGFAEVPVMVARGWSEGQKRAYVLADNKLAMNAGWDPALLSVELADLKAMGVDLNLVGFHDDELAVLLADSSVGLTNPDDVPEPLADPVTRLGDVWILGRTGWPAATARPRTTWPSRSTVSFRH